MSPLREAETSPAKAELDRFGTRLTRGVLRILRNHILPRSLHRFTTANAVTIARMILTIPVLLGIAWNHECAFWLFVAAALSDIADGWIARCDGATKLGALLDSTSDKVTTLPVLAALALKGYFPPWLYGPALVLVVLDTFNLFANIVNFKRGHLDPTSIPPERKRFSTAAGQIKFWGICLGISALLMAHIVSPESGFGLRYFGYFTICVATISAGFSLREKIV